MDDVRKSRIWKDKLRKLHEEHAEEREGAQSPIRSAKRRVHVHMRSPKPHHRSGPTRRRSPRRTRR